MKVHIFEKKSLQLWFFSLVYATYRENGVTGTFVKVPEVGINIYDFTFVKIMELFKLPHQFGKILNAFRKKVLMHRAVKA